MTTESMYGMISEKQNIKSMREEFEKRTAAVLRNSPQIRWGEDEDIMEYSSSKTNNDFKRATYQDLKLQPIRLKPSSGS